MWEKLCGVCPIKYAAMRYMYDDFIASQFGAIKDLIWDISRKINRKVDYEEGMREWTKKQDLGNKTQESYAQRFREVWEFGQRGNKQNLTSTAIYEIVVAKPETYELAIEVLKRLKQESDGRDKT